ncbi:gibberellin cluster-kaurenoxidase (diterpencyclase) [Apiospora rasikravindrae]|uniref:Gibberellin cluster-kaurenoxidase (Diterpencyclase) n=1 Tax=Apiospora rasikravindrae TaxID=990691 RepID=A0ABR1TFS8_9PEZI
MVFLDVDAHTLGHRGSMLLLGIPIVVCIWLVTRPANVIYDSFLRISDGRVRALIWPSHIHDLVRQGYQNVRVTKTTGKPFTVRWWARDFLILPPGYLHALNGADWHHLSFYRTISDVGARLWSESSQLVPVSADKSRQAFFLHTSVGDLYDSKATVEVVTKGLNPRLPRLTSIVQTECDYALDAELDGNPGDTPRAQFFFSAIVHRITSRVLIGDELCRDERFIRNSREFITSIFVTGLLLTKLPLGPLRGWLAYPLAFWHRRKLARCTDMLQPVIRQRIERREQQRHSNEPSESMAEKLDATEWSLALLPPLTCSRTVLYKPYVFPDGLTLPVGTRFGFPTMAMQNDVDAGLGVLHLTDSDVGQRNATTMSTENVT